MKLKKYKIASFLFMFFMCILCTPIINVKANTPVSVSPTRVNGSETHSTVDCVSGYINLSGYSSVSYSIRHYYDPNASHSEHPYNNDYCRGGTFKIVLQDSNGNKVTLDESHNDWTSASSLLYKETVTDAKAIPSAWKDRNARIVITMYCGCYNTSKENYMIIDDVTLVGTAHSHSYTIS